MQKIVDLQNLQKKQGDDQTMREVQVETGQILEKFSMGV